MVVVVVLVVVVVIIIVVIVVEEFSFVVVAVVVVVVVIVIMLLLVVLLLVVVVIVEVQILLLVIFQFSTNILKWYELSHLWVVMWLKCRIGFQSQRRYGSRSCGCATSPQMMLFALFKRRPYLKR